MALVDIGNDSWIKEFDACIRLSREIQNQLVLRTQEQQKNSQGYMKLTTALKFRLKQLSDELNQLKRKLENVNHLTIEETERRQRQLELLQSKYVHLEKEFSFVSVTDVKDQLYNGEGTLAPSALDSSTILENQNNSLQALSDIIARQKNIALKIGDEVGEQNNIIDNLTQQIENNDILINQETNNVVVVQEKDSAWGYWLTIISLFCAIVIVWIV